MILTEKCKEDFLKYCKIYCYEYENSKRGEFFWFGNETDLLHKDCNKFLNALIIEFFDSVGIYIEIIKDASFGFDIHRGDWEKLDYSIGGYNSRKEATKAAIEKANEIYNNI